MEIKEISDKDIWEEFLLKYKEKTFLQSWNWGEFNKMMGSKIWRFGLYKNEKLSAVSLVIKVEAKRATFLFVPHVPDIEPELFNAFVGKLKELAREEKAIFIRIAPIWESNDENRKVFKNMGFRDAPIHMHPEVTWELDISQPEEDLMKNMRKTTRYLIRQAGKNPDIIIQQSDKIEDIEKFHNIYESTVQRHNFIGFPPGYLKNQHMAFSGDSQISTFLGFYKGELVSSAIIVFYQGTAYYHHGASLVKYQKIPVSYLLQLEAIKEAKKRGCKVYNFWGIAPTDNPNHPWAGLSLFKMGFGGYRRDYIKTQDYPLSFRYWINYIIEAMRRKRRNL
ncbi:MAG: peptidoglycan bridge formation glycyltransferase FemA/FemB family protein [Candidatus Parcubacteria bacterium]|nr:peptidoglycan bridge formation glycyltransferase FemA/FemB family protein [Candidatus Parcubacteria bacterium]